MLDRTLAPEFKPVGDIRFIAPQKNILDNQIPFFAINAGQQELVRIEFIFQNLNWQAAHPLQAVAINGLVNSGTPALSAKQIAEQVDYYGAFLQTEYNADYTTITVYSLTKHLAAVLPLVYSILTEAIFPQPELAIYQQNSKQKLQVNLQKNDYIARRTFAHAIFGHTPYGALINLEHYDALQRKQLLADYQSVFTPANCTIIASGKIGEGTVALVNEIFGGGWPNTNKGSQTAFTFNVVAGKSLFIEKQDAVQSAIRMGNLSINRTHPDFPSLQFANCVLGGYFGSRLMANIREDKGYTYGIGSGVASLKQAGYFFIGTEVGVDVCQNALSEIKKEIDLLKTQQIPDEELQLVRNYMLGAMLGSLENAFSHADKFKNIYFSGLDYDYYDRYTQTIKNITAAEVKAVAERYFNADTMVEVVVGKK